MKTKCTIQFTTSLNCISYFWSNITMHWLDNLVSTYLWYVSSHYRKSGNFPLTLSFAIVPTFRVKAMKLEIVFSSDSLLLFPILPGRYLSASFTILFDILLPSNWNVSSCRWLSLFCSPFLPISLTRRHSRCRWRRCQTYTKVKEKRERKGWNGMREKRVLVGDKLVPI